MLLALVAWLALLSPVAYGQGQINFNNTSTTLISTNATVSGPHTGLINGPVGSYYFAVFIAPSGTSDTTAFAFAGMYGTNTGTAGRFSGGQPGFPTYPPGTTLSFLVRGWSANIGNDYAAVTNYLVNPTFDAWYGESQVGTEILGGGGIGIPNIFGSPPRIPGFVLEMYTIPEPSSLTLAALGATAMWLLRRRSF